MKKSILALAVATALTGAAHAQSSVTVYGVADAGIRYQTNVNAAGDGLLSMGTGTHTSNRLGFRGVEDLGGGLTARFQLETGYSVKSGALDNTNNVLFNRTAAVGLGGAWGNVDFGRQYTLAFRTDALLDPFGHKYTSLIPLSSGAGTTLPAAARNAGLGASATSGTRFNNNIQYTGTFGPLTARAEYALGEQAGDTGRGSAQAAGLSYAGGPLLLAGAYTQKETAAGFDNKAYIVGGGYTFGNLRVTVGYSSEEQETAAAGDFENAIVWTGASYKLTPALELTSGYYRTKYESRAADGRRNLFMLGAAYSLSKRTSLYAVLDANRYRGALIPVTGQTSQTGLAAGVMHQF